MFISKFSAFNYRSLKQVIVKFKNGKNVLVGKNNSGKSNIIKGIEILVGEKFPSYITFSDNDFFSEELVDTDTGEIIEQVANDFYIEVELEGRDVDEAMMKTIKKSTAFSKVKSWGELYKKNESTGEILINFDFFQNLDEIESRSEIKPYDGQRLTDWKKPDQLINFIKGAKTIKLFFCKSRYNEEGVGFGMICVDQTGEIWVSHFMSKKLRDSLVTSTVISALRSQKEDLRVVHYTWFGKLIIGLWNQSKGEKPPGSEKSFEELIKDKSTNIKELVDAVFAKETTEIKKLLEGAIAHKSVSFRFLSSKNEIYKNIQMFVNDGIDRPINEKGTGIQNAIISSLISLYCNKFHNNSSLLIAEEPELFLHPQARRVISAELEKFLEADETQPRQLIISTHSTEYLKNVDPLNVIRVYKDSATNSSVAKQIDRNLSGEITIELKRFLWSNNTELFFADKVVLVEGGEVYLLPAIVDKVKDAIQVLDYLNITVARVNGKGSFLTYIKMLKCFDIQYLILGDLDCFKDEIPKLCTFLGITENTEVALNIKKALDSHQTDYAKIADRLKDIEKNFDAQKLENVFAKFQKKEISFDDIELNSVLSYMQLRYTKSDKFKTAIDAVGMENFAKLLATLRNNGIFIWSKGELETYYSDETKQMSGTKDIKPLQLSYLLKEEGSTMEKYFIELDEIELLIETILS